MSREIEEAIVQAFISPQRRARWREILVLPKRRAKFLDGLNHCRDFNARFAFELPASEEPLSFLTSRGAPAMSYVISSSAELDARVTPLAQAISLVELDGWGAIISCIPGRLAYYYGERGEQRLILDRIGN